jgi:NADPH:quinone reductase-like Zn-dependent oxidoreductase
MNAVRIHSFGSADVLQLEDVPKPEPGENEVLIKVHAASVNPVDYKLRSGEFKPVGLTMPVTLGCDISGVVEDVGRDVSGVQVGDEVYALLDTHSGGYAEFAVAKSDGVAPKPASIDHIHAAAVPQAAMTAWQGLFDHGRLKAGERVLIHGAAGGVGHFAVQFAKDRGAYVIATARTEDRGLLRELGADLIIDYTNERFEDHVRDVDLVLDLVAGETQRRSWESLKPGGRLVSTVQPPSDVEAARHHAKGEVFMTELNRDELARIGQMIDDGKVQVLVQQILPLGEVRRAHEHMEHEHIRGKVVLAVSATGQ